MTALPHAVDDGVVDHTRERNRSGLYRAHVTRVKWFDHDLPESGREDLARRLGFPLLVSDYPGAF